MSSIASLNTGLPAPVGVGHSAVVHSVAESLHEKPVSLGAFERTAIQREAGDWNCLVVAPLSASREAIASEVAAGGWSANRCSRIDVALRIARQRRSRLAIVELTGIADEAVGLEELAGEIARAGGLLLVLCTAADSQHEEIQARQLGAWLFLAGEIPVGELTAVCIDARRLLDHSTSSFGLNGAGDSVAASAAQDRP